MPRRWLLIGLIAFMSTSGKGAEQSPADRETRSRLKAGAGVRRDDRTDAIMARFIAVEQIARLPQQEREAQIPRLYREISPPLMSILVEGIMSSFPADLFRRGGFASPGGDYVEYGQQLDDATTRMTPEQMADTILNVHGPLSLNLAAKVRCVQTLRRHQQSVKKLLERDLDSNDAADVNRACATIYTVRLKDFNDRLLKIYLADGKFAAQARSAIIWLNDPAMTAALVADIQKNPAALRRHYGLLNGMLWGRAADPVVVKLLDSPDADARYWAALAIQDCKDASLAPQIIKLLGDKESRLHVAAAHMAGRLPHDAFQAVRAELLRQMGGEDVELRLEAAWAFAEHKDAAGGTALLQFWQHDVPESIKVKVMQSVSQMTDTDFGYNMHEWAKPGSSNMEAIEKFRKWILEHEVREPQR